MVRKNTPRMQQMQQMQQMVVEDLCREALSLGASGSALVTKALWLWNAEDLPLLARAAGDYTVAAASRPVDKMLPVIAILGASSQLPKY